MYENAPIFFCALASASLPAAALFSRPRLRCTQGGACTLLRCNFGPPSGSVRAACSGCSKLRDLALLSNGNALRDAEPRRTMRTPHFLAVRSCCCSITPSLQLSSSRRWERTHNPRNFNSGTAMVGTGRYGTTLPQNCKKTQPRRHGIHTTTTAAIQQLCTQENGHRCVARTAATGRRCWRAEIWMCHVHSL